MNLQQIADRAGVSRMTVSRALRNQPRVSKQTRQRILQIAQELGYQPNPMVSVLMSHVAASRSVRSKPVLVYVYPSLEEVNAARIEEANASYFTGVRDRALQQGFGLEAMQVGTHNMSAQRFSSILKARGIQGVVVAPVIAPLRDRLFYLDLEWDAFSSVAIGYSMEHPDIHRVCLDYYNGLFKGLEQLWAKGFRKFGLYTMRETDERVRHLWTSAFLTFHWTKGIPTEGRIQTPDQLERDHLFNWLDEVRPEVLISHRDEWIAEWYLETMKKIRHECRFVHLDLDQAQSDVSDAGFFGRRVAMGAGAADLLIGQIKRGERGIPKEPQTCLVRPRLSFLKPVW